MFLHKKLKRDVKEFFTLTCKFSTFLRAFPINNILLLAATKIIMATYKQFLAAISLCTNFRLARYSIPLAICMQILTSGFLTLDNAYKEIKMIFIISRDDPY